MKNLEQSPLWVKLAYANIQSRKSALWLIASSVVFTLYCFPWSRYSDHTLVTTFFIFEDWEWFISMLPLTCWYWLALRWADQYQGWEKA